MNKNYYAVIMAGGGGTRMWPVSRSGKPKQMLKIIGDRSLFQMAIDRLDGFFNTGQIFIVTVSDQVNDLLVQVQSLNKSNFLIEPLPRGTASVVGLAAINILMKDKNAVMVILTADHVIGNIHVFHKILDQAYRLAQQGLLVTIGIKPGYPSTGYGYIQAGPSLKDDTYAYQVEKFIEKPGKEMAEDFFQKQNYFWNSGMFIWRADRILEEFERQLPQVYQKLMAISEKLNTDLAQEFLNEIWPQVEKQTIDYGIMENAQDVVVIPARDLGWSDVGSWDSLYELLPMDEHGNVFKHEMVISQDSNNTFVFAENINKIIAIIGLDNIMIVDSEVGLLVCKKSDGQQVKKIIEKIKEKGLISYL